MKFLDQLEEWLITLLIGAATVITFVAVIHRYGSGLPIPGLQDWLISINMAWAQELTIIMFVWMAKFGAAYGVRTGIHVGVDILVETLTGNAKRAMIVAGLLAGALFTVIIGTLGAHLVWHIARTGQTSAVLEVPMWLVYLAVPLGSYLMCFRFLEVAWHFWKTGERPHHDPGKVEGIDQPTPAEGAR